MTDVVLKNTNLNCMDNDVNKKVFVYCQEKVEALLEKAGEFCIGLEASGH